MESKTEHRHTSIPSRDFNLSASVTVVGTNPTPNPPGSIHCAPLSPTSSSSSPSSLSEGLSDVQEEPIQGWPKLALLMGKTPDFAAFPRFRDLNVKSLLYYQCQLTILRRKLHKLEHEDAAAGNDWNEWADDLMEATESEQFNTIMEMRIVLKEYSELAICIARYARANHCHYRRCVATILPDMRPPRSRTIQHANAPKVVT